MILPNNIFENIVKHTPLISIDLIIRNIDNHFLLGLRNNRPAANFWFVPGGRIRKGESINFALNRIILEELGYPITISNTKLIGVYEHFYDDNCFDNNNYGTHYVVLAYELYIDNININSLPQIQHRKYKWFPFAEINNNELIHKYSKDYFR